MLVLVRNPLDTILAFANLMLLESHNLEPNEPYYEKFPEWWDQWVIQMAREVAKSHEFVMQEIAKKIPTCIVRYEDLVINPAAVLGEVFRFMLDMTSLDGTVVE